jgi:hypothetical protein
MSFFRFALQGAIEFGGLKMAAFFGCFGGILIMKSVQVIRSILSCHRDIPLEKEHRFGKSDLSCWGCLNPLLFQIVQKGISRTEFTLHPGGSWTQPKLYCRAQETETNI